MRRVQKEEAALDLRMLNVMQAAHSSTQSKRGAKEATKLANRLRSVVNAVPIGEQDAGENRKKAVGSLLKLGAVMSRRN